MQSTISTRGLLSQISLGRVLPIVFDICLLVDIFLSSYFFFFSPDRTYGYGIWILLLFQMFFLPVFIVIAYLNIKTLGLNQSETIDGASKSKKSQPLAYTLQKADIETEIRKPINEKKLKVLKTFIYWGFALDVVIGLNFMILSALIAGGGGDGNIAINSYILDQIYYLPPILLMIFYYYHLKGSAFQTRNFEVIKGTKIDSKTPKTFLSTIKIRKGMRIFILISLILLILFVAVFAYAKQVEDNQTNYFKLYNKGPYGSVQIYGMYESQDKIDVIAFGRLEGPPPSHHLLRYTIDLETNTIEHPEQLSNLPYGFSGVVDSVVTDDEIYFLILDNREWNYMVYKYAFDTESLDLLYLWNLGLTGQDFGGSSYFEWLFKYGQFVYMLSPYDDGVHLIQTQIPHFFRPELTNIRSIDSNGMTEQSLNLTALDVITHNDKTQIIHISDSTPENFDLVTYDGVGVNFTDSSLTNTILTSKYSEDIYGLPTANSATLFVLEGTLYYRSTQNLFDIDNMKSSDISPNVGDSSFNFVNRGLRGVAIQDDLLFLNTGTEIQYTSIDDLGEIENAIAKNAEYSGSQYSNILISGDTLVTASDNGRIFTWEIEPKLIREDRDSFNQILQIGIIIYLVSSSIYFVIRRKV